MAGRSRSSASCSIRRAARALKLWASKCVGAGGYARHRGLLETRKQVAARPNLDQLKHPHCWRSMATRRRVLGGTSSMRSATGAQHSAPGRSGAYSTAITGGADKSGDGGWCQRSQSRSCCCPVDRLLALAHQLPQSANLETQSHAAVLHQPSKYTSAACHTAPTSHPEQTLALFTSRATPPRSSQPTAHARELCRRSTPPILTATFSAA